ncbi:MAG: hypothetical protein QGG71_23985, partial [Pirellulaceae bacterium]|nr:hypothetical protein [Pirellulaceae bacterium]
IDKDEVRIVYKVQCHPFVPSPVKRGFLQDCLECHIVAQGQRRSRATLGKWKGKHLHAEGVRQSRDVQRLQR